MSFYITSDRIFTGGTLNVETISYFNKLDPNDFSDYPQMSSLQHFLFKKRNIVKLVVLINQKQSIYCSSQECFQGDRLQHRTLR